MLPKTAYQNIDKMKKHGLLVRILVRYQRSSSSKVHSVSFCTFAKNIFLKQKQAVRIIFLKNRLTHSRPLMKSLLIWQRYITLLLEITLAPEIIFFNLYQISLFMYQVKNGNVPKIFDNNFSSVDHSYSTRFSLNSFQVPRSLKTSKFSIIIRGPKIWNHFLTNEEKDNHKILSFKRNLKKKIFDFDNELFYF